MSKIGSNYFDSVVFEDRNQQYGAFFLRRLYKNNIVIAFFTASVIITTALASPLIYTAFAGEEVEEEQKRIVTVVMENYEKIEVPEPEIPEEKPPVVQAATVKSLPPEVKPDKDVPKEELPPTEEDIKDKNVGEVNQEGEKVNPVVEEVSRKVEAAPEPVKIETWAEQMPEFPGGPSEFLKYLRKNIVYPQAALDNEIQGTVMVGFVVNVDGSISDIRVVRSVNPSLDQEALRVFKKMPKWNPAQKKGRTVPLRMTSPVVFVISD